MRLRVTTVALLMALAGPAWAEPPAHAPAHGYRAKHRHHDRHHHHANRHHERHERAVHSGVEVVFDSERGVHIAVGLPGLFFHEGSFYRHVDGSWHMSLRADRGWNPASTVPTNVMNAWQSGQAKHESRR